jgi:hypothetical protein
VLSLVGDLHALRAGVLAVTRDPGGEGRGASLGGGVGRQLGLREGADDQDLVPVGRHDGGPHEPVGGDAAGEPALELIG